jgi:hypothetical protein
MRVLLCVFVTLTFAAFSLNAHLPEYSPFPSTQEVKLFPVQKLAVWTTEQPDGNSYLNESHRTRGSRNPILLRSQRKTDDGSNLTILTWDKKRLAGPFHISSSPVEPYGYFADLNGDGALDYIVIIGYGNNGVCDIAFVVSQANGYKVSMVTTLYSGESDFLDLRGDGQFYFLHSSIFNIDEQIRGKDGQHHNYWIYNLLALEGGALKPANSSASGFPKWILWTFRANHDETDQFTAEQKLRLFDPEKKCIVSTPDHPCPGYFQQ